MSCIYGRYKKMILIINKICYSIACPSITSSTASFVCLQPQSYTFWRLQQVNQFNWELGPSPLKQAYSTECLLYSLND